MAKYEESSSEAFDSVSGKQVYDLETKGDRSFLPFLMGT